MQKLTNCVNTVQNKNKSTIKDILSLVSKLNQNIYNLFPQIFA